MSTRIALGIEYNGQDFFGWQDQRNLPTIQGHLEHALSLIANESITVFCAGRTDAAVHATGQVVHFDTSAIRSLRAWVYGTNTHLPSSIAVRWACEVNNEFHARFSASSRQYRYIIYNHSVRSALLTARATWHHYPLNAETMHESAQYLIGELDFSAFRSAQCESKTPMRHVQKINVVRHNEFIVIDIQANAFLHHMVRNITGSLIKVGEGIKKPSWIQEVMLSKDRRYAAETAPAAGLYLIKVIYSDKYSLPEVENPILCF